MYKPAQFKLLSVYGVDESVRAMRLPKRSDGDTENGNIGEKDARLIKALIKAGDSHAKAVRGIIAYIEIDMQVGWMIEFETYRIGVECLSTTSAMFGELKKLKGVPLANKKQADLPEKFYKRIIVINYQAIRRMYHERKNHRHPDWQLWRAFVETLPHFDLLIAT